MTAAVAVRIAAREVVAEYRHALRHQPPTALDRRSRAADIVVNTYARQIASMVLRGEEPSVSLLERYSIAHRLFRREVGRDLERVVRVVRRIQVAPSGATA